MKDSISSGPRDAVGLIDDFATKDEIHDYLASLSREHLLVEAAALLNKQCGEWVYNQICAGHKDPYRAALTGTALELLASVIGWKVIEEEVPVLRSNRRYVELLERREFGRLEDEGLVDARERQMLERNLIAPELHADWKDGLPADKDVS